MQNKMNIKSKTHKCVPRNNRINLSDKVIGLFAGKENAFLIQNAFPVIRKYFDHIHTIQEQPVLIHKKLDKLLVENLSEVLAMYNRGIKLTFTDITAIRTIMEKELENRKDIIT